MSAAEALKVARAVGIRVEIGSDDLVLEAPTAPPPKTCPRWLPQFAQ
jgi:hypothetical protein